MRAKVESKEWSCGSVHLIFLIDWLQFFYIRDHLMFILWTKKEKKNICVICYIQFPYWDGYIPSENMYLGGHVENLHQTRVTVHPAESTCTIWCSVEMYETWEGLWKHTASNISAKSSLRSSLTLLQSVWEGDGEIKTARLTDWGLIFFISGFRLIKTDLPC